MMLKPASGHGNWSVGLLVTFIAGFAALVVAIAAGEKGGDTFTDNWWLAGPGLAAAASGIGAFVIGLIALIRDRERSLAVMVATVVGALVTLSIALEIAFPH